MDSLSPEALSTESAFTLSLSPPWPLESLGTHGARLLSFGSSELWCFCLPLQVWREGESHPDREGHLHGEGGEELPRLPHRQVGEW